MFTFVPCATGSGRASSLLTNGSSFTCAGARPTTTTALPARGTALRTPGRPAPSQRSGAAGAVASGEFNYNIYQDSKDRSRRTVDSGERVVTIEKPLGIVLEEGQDGMVFVASVDARGNAAQAEDIHEGDVVVAVSATFGDEVWSTRGVGLDRVLKSIRVRSGNYVTLVLETPDKLSERKESSTLEAEARRKLARDTRGEREVLNPVTWGVTKGAADPSTGESQATYEYGDPAQAQIDEKLKQRLKNEMAAPYEQNWILWISGGIFLLVIIAFIAGLR